MLLYSECILFFNNFNLSYTVPGTGIIIIIIYLLKLPTLVYTVHKFTSTVALSTSLALDILVYEYYKVLRL